VWFTNNIKYTSDRKFIQLYACQKLSKKVSIWKSFGKIKTVQFFASQCIYCVSKWVVLNFCNNFARSRSIITFFSLLERGWNFQQIHINIPTTSTLPCDMQETFENGTNCADNTIKFYHVRSFIHVQSVVDIIAEFAQNNLFNLRASSHMRVHSLIARRVLCLSARQHSLKQMPRQCLVSVAGNSLYHHQFTIH